MVSQEILSVKLTSGPFWGIFFHSFLSLEIISILKIFGTLSNASITLKVFPLVSGATS